jgi:exonuclease III
MDYNENHSNTNLNYYPISDSPSSNLLFHTHPQLYNDNSLNPPSTSNDVMRYQILRDSLQNNNIIEEPPNNFNKHLQKRPPYKKINKPYKENNFKNTRIINNPIDEETLKALNTNIYNIQKDYIKLGVINIQKGLSNKLEDLIEFRIDKSYHILALTEIGKTYNNSNKPQCTINTKVNTYNDEPQTYHVYTYNKSHNVNEGVGIIMNDHIAKHVIKTEGFENHILIITMCFRRNINIKLIIVYLPANKTDYAITEKCNNIIKEQITQAHNKNTQIILMGDFNIGIKDIKTNKHKSDKNWKIKKEIITFINSQNLIDSTKYYQNTLQHIWTLPAVELKHGGTTTLSY